MSDRPLVGVSFGGVELGYADSEARYLAALEAAGAEPLVVRPGAEEELPGLLRRVEGWLLPGGDDLSPEYYGEEPVAALRQVHPARDRMDLLTARAVLAAGMPLLGICAGMQTLNVAAGGTLHQDIATTVPGFLDHEDGAVHEVVVAPGTRLASVTGPGPFPVNSHHHQAVKRTGAGLVVAAHTSDGIVEAVERPGAPFVVGVQWHPERPGCTAAASVGLLAAFIGAVRGWDPGRFALRAPPGS